MKTEDYVLLAISYVLIGTGSWLTMGVHGIGLVNTIFGLSIVIHVMRKEPNNGEETGKEDTN